MTVKALKFFIVFFAVILLIAGTSCDSTFVDIYTQVNTDFSGTRSVELAVKTQYLQKGEIILDDSESMYDKVIDTLPGGKLETYEKEDYTYFKSTVEFDDINFLQHVSIDNFSESPPERFYAKIEKNDYFFYTDYFFYDYIDMEIDPAIIESQGQEGDFSRAASLFSADEELLQISYQVKFPVKIMDSDADVSGEDNIAIWNLKFGEKRNVYIEGKKIKYLSYVLVVILGLIGLFIIFLIFVLLFSRKRRIKKLKKPHNSYDNYFKKDQYFSPLEDRDDY
ncbi:MAG: hypothetical protein JW997_04610 [Actinobacteria bacterium]|nr:hypothetical protein [Actinomycetota bacterium]